MIEEDIKKEFDDYEIKTTSNMILNKYSKSKAKKTSKKRIFFPLIFTLTTASLLICIVALSIGIGISNSNQSSEVSYTSSVSLSDSGLTSQVAIEVLYAGNMSSNSNKSSKQSISTSDFTTIVNNVDEIYPLISDLYNGLDKFEITYYMGEYKIGSIIYNYKYKIDDYILYANDNMFKKSEKHGEVEIEGEVALAIGNNVYSGSLEVEIEDDEQEVKLTYSAGTQKVTIKREYETEDNETETVYSYRVVEDDYEYVKKITAKEVDGVKSFKYKYENDYNNISEKLRLYENSDYYLINYLYESDDSELNIEGLKLTLDNSNRVYTYDDMTLTK